ncbi:MAG: tRNA (adenosine(37)-N6)-threonylcarbamoyltransferase complex ATPase subunit type 1 TsaE [Bacteroidota bacterium]|nr:tRNA (adenosine(37)-N6)-threonylcarbamoyltransferase complex ATPase subunit type 1 TsaE [Bacteroidota bacterium]
MEWIFTLDNINMVAKEFWKATEGKTVFAIHGPMGAGKTTFIHALCDAKAVKDVVGSPTFSIINEYQYVPVDIGSEGTTKVLFHLDLYRLKNEEEAVRAGVEDAFYSGYICLVEWPEKAPGIFPDSTTHVYIEMVDSTTRRLKISNN